MTIIKCDFCGTETEKGGEKNLVPYDYGWATLITRKMNVRYERDVCPHCVPEETNKTNRES